MGSFSLRAGLRGKGRTADPWGTGPRGPVRTGKRSLEAGPKVRIRMGCGSPKARPRERSRMGFWSLRDPGLR